MSFIKLRGLLVVGILICFTACTGQDKQVSLIFDTDMAPDYDDVGALAMLHAMADAGEVDILATISSNKYEYSVPCIEVINTYFGRPDIPIGVVKGEGPNRTTWHTGLKWPEELPRRYPHTIKSSSDAEDAVKLYRRILQEQPNNSVTIVTVGFFTNLKNLLQSPPDEISPLPGEELVAKKVKNLVSMGGVFPEGKEFNIEVDVESSQIVFNEWPSPILLSGWEIGAQIHTGKRLVGLEKEGNPVADAYAMSLQQDNPEGRESWDQTTVLVAVRGTDKYFDYENGTFTVLDDGSNTWTPNKKGKHARLLFKMPIYKLTSEIEELMMHQPAISK